MHLSKLMPPVAATLALFQFSAQAQTEPLLSPLEVTVTGGHSLARTTQTPGQVITITRAQIEASGAQSLVEALRASGAVQISQNTTGNANDGVVSMRGFGENAGQNVLILVDGRPLNNPTLEAPALSMVSLNQVERIEVLHGSAGTLFGQRAVGGVINILTKPVADRRQGKVTLSRGSREYTRVQGRLSDRYQSGFGYALNLERESTDGYRDNSATEYDHARIDLSYRHQQGEITYSHESINNNQRLPGSLSRSQVDMDRQQSITPSDRFDEQLSVDAISFAQQLDQHLRLDTQLSQRESDGKGYLYGDYSQDMRVRSFTPRLDGRWSHNGGMLNLTAGLDLTDSDYLSQSSLGTTDSSQTTRAVYLRASYPLSDKWALTLGGRHSQVKDSAQGTGSDQTQSAFVKEIGIDWTPTAGHHLFLRRDENLRFATIDENGWTLPGIDALDPQQGVSWEAGWDYTGAEGRLAVTLYQLELDDEILYDPALMANINLDSSRRRGLTLSAQRQLTPALRIGGSYAYTDSELTSGSFTGNQVPYVAEHRFSLFGNYRINAAWNLYSDLQYTGERYLAGDDANTEPKLDADVVVNASLRWNQGPWQAQLSVNNLLDEAYHAYAGYSSWSGAYYYPAAQRNLLLSLGYTF
ncbi:MAG: hypothetical protein CMI01_16735 [Oceanospirillaceae bacterium]|jgi:iron complex outermembrane receptor protein|nr:hypothetical protein [Oceanospirillaceae bacterium]